MQSAMQSIVVWVVRGIVLSLCLPAAVQGATAGRTEQLSLFDLSITELMDVEITISAAGMGQTDRPDDKRLHQVTTCERKTQPVSSQDAAEPCLPPLPFGKPATFDGR